MFRVKGLWGLGVSGFGFRVGGLGCLGFSAEGLVFWGPGLGRVACGCGG